MICAEWLGAVQASEKQHVTYMFRESSVQLRQGSRLEGDQAPQAQSTPEQEREEEEEEGEEPEEERAAAARSPRPATAPVMRRFLLMPPKAPAARPKKVLAALVGFALYHATRGSQRTKCLPWPQA